MLDTSIDLLPHTSGLTKKRFHLVGINTYEDLLKYPPNRYEDFSQMVKIIYLKNFLDKKITLQGIVISIAVVKTRSHISLQKVTIEDATGKTSLTFFNQPYLISQLKKGLSYAFSGTVKLFGPSYTLQPETFELISENGVSGVQTGRILPVYSEAKGLSSRLLREKIMGILPLVVHIEETLPAAVINQNGLQPLPTALQTLHRPLKMEHLVWAKERLAFEELFILQLSTALIKKNWSENCVTEIITYSQQQRKKVEVFINSLPFTLTPDQKSAFEDIVGDLVKKQPMNRFLQGDVGSGKTVVAVLAAYVSYLSGKKTLYMAPTEILALQHAETFIKLLAPLGVKIGVQTGSKKDLSKGTYDIVIGTHALLSAPVFVAKTALVIIDEQHRFGVKQRALLRAKGTFPHLLTMTATPIPRTVALTAFGELDMSVLSSMPTGRKPIKTFVVTQSKRKDAYEWIKKEITSHAIQIFIICPLVEESETETLSTVKAATTEYHVTKSEFNSFTVGLLHGKMKPQDKNTVLSEFREKKIDILVATSVVEVGIDIPNACIMIIEGAERFGLSQLHQLRGRVGRGSVQSYCLLFSSSNAAPQRLHFFASTSDGMKLAEYDLKERGPGNIFGIEQHGFMEMRFASFTDSLLIQKTQKAISTFLGGDKKMVDSFLNVRMGKFQIDKITKD